MTWRCSGANTAHASAQLRTQWLRVRLVDGYHRPRAPVKPGLFWAGHRRRGVCCRPRAPSADAGPVPLPGPRKCSWCSSSSPRRLPTTQSPNSERCVALPPPLPRSWAPQNPRGGVARTVLQAALRTAACDPPQDCGRLLETPAAGVATKVRELVPLLTPCNAVLFSQAGLIEFKDLNADKSAFQRTYANQVRP